MTIEAVIFDLDNTLYDEKQYMMSGFKAVSNHMTVKYKIDGDELYDLLLKLFITQGRRKVFDKALMRVGLYKKDIVSEMVEVYRNHSPDIQLYRDAQEVLPEIKKKYRIGLITGGIKKVQESKVQALGIGNLLDATTYAIEHGGKNNTQTFLLTLEKLRVKPFESIYIDDDPTIGFAIPEKLGIHTVRIMKGEHKSLKVDSHFEAEFRIESLRQLFSVVRSFQQK